MLDVLASMSQPLRAALPIGAIGVATAAVAVSCGYAQVASQDPDVRRLVSYINGPTVPLLLSALMAGGAEFVQAWVLYNPQIYMPFARTVFFAARSFAVALSTPIFLGAMAILFVQCFVRRHAKDAFATVFFGGLAVGFTGPLRVFDAWLTPLVSRLCASWLPGEHDAIAARLFVPLALQLLIEVGGEGYYAPTAHACADVAFPTGRREEDASRTSARSRFCLRPRRCSPPPSLACSSRQRRRHCSADADGQRCSGGGGESNGLRSSGAAAPPRPYARVRTLWVMKQGYDNSGPLSTTARPTAMARVRVPWRHEASSLKPQCLSHSSSSVTWNHVSHRGHGNWCCSRSRSPHREHSTPCDWMLLASIS
jgi:hypothetical protein